jgi:hypothetical protein
VSVLVLKDLSFYAIFDLRRVIDGVCPLRVKSTTGVMAFLGYTNEYFDTYIKLNYLRPRWYAHNALPSNTPTQCNPQNMHCCFELLPLGDGQSLS